MVSPLENSLSKALNIASYMTLRSQQTQQAYTQQPIEVQQESNMLFKVLFVALYEQLEAGHTVLVLSAQTNNMPISHKLAHIMPVLALSSWQVTLVQPLILGLYTMLKPLETMAEQDSNDSHITNDEASQWLAMLSDSEQIQWKQLLASAYLNNDEQRCVQKVYDLLQQFVQFCWRFNQVFTKENSLSNFIEQLNNNNHHWLYYQNSHTPNISDIQNYNATPIIINRVENDFICWLHRAWMAEYQLAYHIQRISSQQLPALNIDVKALPKALKAKQIEAIELASHSAFSIITGGPGTGKTYTVAQIVLALFQNSHVQTATSKDGLGEINKEAVSEAISEPPALALAAPTGKAAQRMQESLQNALSTQEGDLIVLEEAQTIHRLLAIGRSGVPRYNYQNPLPYDVIVIDEASMLGVELATHLLCAIKPTARLILLGDANQLAAVDAGAVLADLCRIECLQSYHVALKESRRFDEHSGIGKLANIINRNVNPSEYAEKVQQIEAVFTEADDVRFYPVLSIQEHQGLEDSELSHYLSLKNSLSKYNLFQNLIANYQNYFNLTKKLTSSTIANSIPHSREQAFLQIFATLSEFRILSAGHLGELGDVFINQQIAQAHQKYLNLPLSDQQWYHGRPVMLLANDYDLGLFNGDIGICLHTGWLEGKGNNQYQQLSELKVWFEGRTQPVSIHRLSEENISTAYAMTIHKSQGSEFDQVAVMMDFAHQRLLTQELIYTAITRAKKQVSIFSAPELLVQAVTQRTQRQTGLEIQFTALNFQGQ
ncbi:exodeoxyribonuclease V subunit alpha [Psychrobacter sp. I-STPA6b]|uniref:exodeoxyribonuclease V subunit alpha n=1 Tax=Psychrobacter sp. I-STPA6b TaxID=2585718 RepID=UPI001D0CD2E3|nr:exodeoxyribonuclease V subunit alpha [Psychrobacter sp. I-STPA6b]